MERQCVRHDSNLQKNGDYESYYFFVGKANRLACIVAVIKVSSRDIN